MSKQLQFAYLFLKKFAKLYFTRCQANIPIYLGVDHLGE